MRGNFSEDVVIDNSALDVEWLEQPRLVASYSKLFADTKKEMDIVKDRVDFIKAKIDKSIRLNPEKYGISKVSENAIQNIIFLQEEYQEASNDLIEARYQNDLAKGMLQAIIDRKEALENLVRLHGMQYFAGPSIPRNLDKEWEAKQKQKNVNNDIAKKMKRKK